MLAELETGYNVSLSTARAWQFIRPAILVLCVVGLLVSCGLWSGDDESPTPTAATDPTSTPVATPQAVVQPTATATSAPSLTANTPVATAEPASPPLPTVAIDALQPSTRLAYFHTMADPTGQIDEIVRLASFVTLTHGDEPFRDQLRAAGYSGPVQQYLNASQVNGPGPYANSDADCDESFRPLRNGIVRGTGAFCQLLHPNEDWFLHNGAGERLYTIIGETGVWYHMNPGNPEWRAFASQEFARDVVGPQALGFEGLLLDNVELSLTRVAELAVNADGVVQEYASDANYRNAWTDYLRQIRLSVGDDIQLWANLVSDTNNELTWAGYVAELDGVMVSAFATGYDAPSAMAWENNIEQAAAVLAAGKGLVAVGIGAREDLARQQFALASYLLISDGANASFRYLSNDWNQTANALWLYPNYDIRLGTPLGDREPTESGWRRAFQCGYVEVSPVERTGAIVETECSNETAP